VAPNIVSLRIWTGNRFKLRLWLPVFLLWPFAVLLVLVIAPFLVLAEVFMALRGTPMHFFGMLAGVFSLLSALRGTIVNIDSPGSHTLIHVAIY